MPTLTAIPNDVVGFVRNANLQSIRAVRQIVRKMENRLLRRGRVLHLFRNQQAASQRVNQPIEGRVGRHGRVKLLTVEIDDNLIFRL